MIFFGKRCECGCGKKVTLGKRFIRGHNARVFTDEVKQKISKKLSGRVVPETVIEKRRRTVAMKGVKGVYGKSFLLEALPWYVWFKNWSSFWKRR